MSRLRAMMQPVDAPPADAPPVIEVPDGNGNGSASGNGAPAPAPPQAPKPVREPKPEKLKALKPVKAPRVKPARPTRPVRPSYQRNYRQTVRKVDLWTVLKISICFYVTALIVVLFAGMVLWWIASAVGVIGNIENFIGELVNSDDFEFLSWEVLRASTLVGLVLVCLMVVCTVLAAAFYNMFSQLLGGVEIVIVEEDSVTRS